MANARRTLKSKKSSLGGLDFLRAPYGQAAAHVKEDQDPAGFGRGFSLSPCSSGSTQRRRTMTAFEGLWLPLITPFRDGALDEASLRRMARHYLASAGRRLDPRRDDRRGADDRRGRDRAAGRRSSRPRSRGQRPVYLGVSGSDTRKVAKALARHRRVAGRRLPDRVPVLHAALAGRASIAISRRSPARPRGRSSIYNIPYRTGVNLANDTLLRLAELPNIVGVKDCCADQVQSFDLMRAQAAMASP